MIRRKAEISSYPDATATRRQRAGMIRWGARRARSYRAWAETLALFGYRRMLRDALRGLPEAGTAIDAGCGDGEALRCLRRERPRWRALACDLSGAFLRQARSRLHPEATLFCVADAERLPCVPHSCDAVLSFGVLAHLLDPQTALAEMGRALRPGGRLVVWTRSDGWMSRRIAGAFERENRGVAFMLHDPRAIEGALGASEVEILRRRRIAGGILWIGEKRGSAR